MSVVLLTGKCQFICWW